MYVGLGKCFSLNLSFLLACNNTNSSVTSGDLSQGRKHTTGFFIFDDSSLRSDIQLFFNNLRIERIERIERLSYQPLTTEPTTETTEPLLLNQRD